MKKKNQKKKDLHSLRYRALVCVAEALPAGLRSEVGNRRRWRCWCWCCCCRADWDGVVKAAWSHTGFGLGLDFVDTTGEEVGSEEEEGPTSLSLCMCG